MRRKAGVKTNSGREKRRKVSLGVETVNSYPCYLGGEGGGRDRWYMERRDGAAKRGGGKARRSKIINTL